MSTPSAELSPRPTIRVFVCGPWGSGKSTFLSTFPKPMLVLQTDPPGKEAPYLRRGVNIEEEEGAERQLIYRVYSPKQPDRLLIQVEIFGDEIIQKPHAFRDFEKRFYRIPHEVYDGQWATVIIDGATELEYASRKQAEHIDKKGYKDQKAFYASSAHDVEQIIKQAARLRCNVGVAAHISSNYDEVKGHEVHGPDLPGKFRGRVGAGFTELYVAHNLGATKNQPEQFWLQTRTNHEYAASSVLLEAPNPCEPHYQALWANYQAPVVKPITASPEGTSPAGDAQEE